MLSMCSADAEATPRSRGCGARLYCNTALEAYADEIGGHVFNNFVGVCWQDGFLVFANENCFAGFGHADTVALECEVRVKGGEDQESKAKCGQKLETLDESKSLGTLRTPFFP